MQNENPYAPPVETSDMPIDQPRQFLHFTEQGWEIVASLAKWMKFVAIVQYIAGALLLSFSMLAAIGRAKISTELLEAKESLLSNPIYFFILSIYLLLGATWLFQAAKHFYNGVLSDTERALAQGFRKLRWYLILYGCWGIGQLFSTVTELLMTWTPR